jgi:hypothetical protein
MDRTSLTLVLVVASFLLPAACASPPAKPGQPPRTCVPDCHRRSSCAELDARLVDARQPLLECVGREAGHGNLAQAHRCYRSLRLLESARWWLKTLLGQNELDSVYMPADNIKLEFLCRIEALSRARTPEKVEALYLDMIRSYP